MTKKQELTMIGEETMDSSRSLSKVDQFVAGLYSGFGQVNGCKDERTKELTITTRKKEIQITVRVTGVPRGIGDGVAYVVDRSLATNSTEINGIPLISPFWAGREVMRQVLAEGGVQ